MHRTFILLHYALSQCRLNNLMILQKVTRRILDTRTEHKIHYIIIKVGVVVGVLYYGQSNQGWLVVALCIIVISL